MINKMSFLMVLLLGFTSLVFAQNVKFQLSSHILDVTKGTPASHVEIKLSKLNQNGSWIEIDDKYTDENGRIQDFLKVEKGLSNEGVYKLTYFVSPYFKKQNQTSFYPFIEVVFEINDEKHYHVPITLSPFGYATYRGN